MAVRDRIWNLSGDRKFATKARMPSAKAFFKSSESFSQIEAVEAEKMHQLSLLENSVRNFFRGLKAPIEPAIFSIIRNVPSSICSQFVEFSKRPLVAILQKNDGSV